MFLSANNITHLIVTRTKSALIFENPPGTTCLYTSYIIIILIIFVLENIFFLQNLRVLLET